MADGSFLIKKSGAICYQLKQKNNYNLMYNILLLFNTSVNLSINKGKYIQLILSSKKDIQKVIKIFFNNNIYLLGNKRISYEK